MSEPLCASGRIFPADFCHALTPCGYEYGNCGMCAFEVEVMMRVTAQE